MEAAETLTRQFLTFALADELFAIDVRMAREVLDLVEVTGVPDTPDYMTGVINLRGRVVPVIDLRRRFGMPVTERTRDSCIVVVDVDVDDDTVTIGALADAVCEVLDFDDSRIEPPPRIGTKLKVEFIQGMGSLDDTFVIILDINKVFTTDELVLAQGLVNEETEG